MVVEQHALGITLWLWSSMQVLGTTLREEAHLKNKRKGLETYKVRASFLVTVTVTFSALLFVPTCQKRNIDMHC